MTLADQLTTDLDVFFDLDEFAQTVTYDNGTTPTSIKAVVDPWGAVRQSGSQSTVKKIMVKKADVPVPDYRHSFVIDGTTWYIKSDPDKGLDAVGDDQVWEIGIVTDERSSAWRT